MATAAELMIKNREKRLEEAQRRLGMWCRLRDEVLGSIHAFATEEDSAHIAREIAEETVIIKSLEQSLEELRNPPEEAMPLVKFRISAAGGLYHSPEFYALKHLNDVGFTEIVDELLRHPGPYYLEIKTMNVPNQFWRVEGELRDITG